MVRGIIFTAREYKEKYKGLMQSFILEYEDYEEIDFIKSEMLLYEKYKSFNFSLRTSNHFAGRTLPDGYNVILNAMEKQIRDKIYSIDNEFNEQLFENVNLSFNKIIEFLDHKKENPSPIETKARVLEDVYLGQPTNDKANKLFDYLVENYRTKKETSVKYVNILHYLKNDVPKDLYIFNLIQDDYKKLIHKKCSIEIKKFAKSEQYDNVEKHILNTLLISFSRQKD